MKELGMHIYKVGFASHTRTSKKVKLNVLIQETQPKIHFHLVSVLQN